MGKPLSFEKQITKKRIVEAIEEIEGEVSQSAGGSSYISAAGIRQLRELRLALESKPVVDSVQ